MHRHALFAVALLGAVSGLAHAASLQGHARALLEGPAGFVPVAGSPRSVAFLQFGTNATDELRSLAADWEAGVLYAAGSTQGAFPGHPEPEGAQSIVCKLDAASGEGVWCSPFGVSTGNDHAAVWVGVHAGDAYVLGNTAGPLGEGGVAALSGSDTDDAYLVRLNASTGAVQWAAQFGTSGDDAAAAAAIDSHNGFVVTVGSSRGTLPGFTRVAGQHLDAVLMVRSLADGSHVWYHQLGSTSASNEAWLDVKLEHAGTWLFAAGYTDAPVLNGQAFTDESAVVAQFSAVSQSIEWTWRRNAVSRAQALAISSDDAHLFVATGEAVVCLNAANGQQEWLVTLATATPTRWAGIAEAWGYLAVVGTQGVAGGQADGALVVAKLAAEDGADAAWTEVVADGASTRFAVSSPVIRNDGVVVVAATIVNGTFPGFADAQGNMGLMSVQDEDFAEWIDNPPTVVGVIANQLAKSGEAFQLTIPTGVFADDRTAEPDLVVTGTVALLSGPGLGGAEGIAVQQGAPGVANVSGVPTLVGGGLLAVTLTVTDEASQIVQLTFNITVTDEFPFVDEPIADAVAFAGVSFHLAVPLTTFDDVLTPRADLAISGTVEEVEGQGLGGVVGISVQGSSLASAVVSGTCTLIGNSVLRVNITAADAAGQAVTTSFLITVTDQAPTVANAIPPQAALGGQLFTFTVPVDTFTDELTPGAQLQISGSVAIATGGLLGGDVGISVAQGAQGSGVQVSGICTLIDDSVLTVTLTATDEAGQNVSTSFTIAVTDEPPEVATPVPNMQAVAGEPFAFTVPANTFIDHVTDVPQLDVRGTTAVVTFRQLGGRPGLRFTRGAPGAASVSGTCTLVGNSVLRVELTCTDEAGKSVQTSFTITFIDQAPTVLVAPSAAAYVAGRAFVHLVPDNVFADAITPTHNLRVTGTLAVTTGGSQGTLGLVFTPGAPGDAAVRGTCKLVGSSTVTVTLTATDAAGNAVTTSFALSFTDEAPHVHSSIPPQPAVAGRPFSMLVPTTAFADAVSPTATLVVSGAVAVHASAALGGAAGITVTPGAPGVARVHGTCTLVGASVLRVTLTCTDQAGLNVQSTFDIAVSDLAPVVAQSISDMTIAAGEQFELPLQPTLFSDFVTPSEELTVSGHIAVVRGGKVGGQLGLRVVPGVLGEARVVGTSSLVGGALARVTLLAEDAAGGVVKESFDIDIVDHPPTLNPELAAPDATAVAGQAFEFTVPAAAFQDSITPSAALRVAGAVTVVSQSSDIGQVGITVTPGAPGVARVHGTCTLVGASVLRVTLTCTDEAGGVATDEFLITVTDEAPFVNMPIANATVLPNEPFSMTVPTATFGDLVTPTTALSVTGEVEVLVNASSTWEGAAEAGISVVPGALGMAKVEGATQLAPGSRLRVTLTVTDEAGGTASTSFDIGVVAEPQARSVGAGAIVAVALVGSAVVAAAVLVTLRPELLPFLRPARGPAPTPAV